VQLSTDQPSVSARSAPLGNIRSSLEAAGETALL
jgi:hypothetical protein